MHLAGNSVSFLTVEFLLIEPQVAKLQAAVQCLMFFGTLCTCVACSGPFRFVDLYGADRLVAKMREFEKVYGDVFTPCQMLLDYAKDPSSKFHTK